MTIQKETKTNCDVPALWQEHKKELRNFILKRVKEEDLTNDIWVSLERAKYFAENWGSEFINIGDAGHINTTSGHTNWEEGLTILKKLG